MAEITLVGIGCGNSDYLTEAGKKAISDADILVGAARMLETADSDAEKITAVRTEDIIDIIENNAEKNIGVIFSGDTGFYSGTTRLTDELIRREKAFRIVPGISSIQMLSAKLGIPWQDWNLVSAHGRDCNILGKLMEGKDTFFLTGGNVVPSDVCRILTEAGLGKTRVFIGERLSYDDERITEAAAEELTAAEFDKLAVMLVKAVPVPEKQVAGIDDEQFIRGNVPMTKQDVRASVMARMNIAPGETIWDVGAGTGSVSVEMALAAKGGTVYAVECVSEGCELIRANREKFRTWNLTVVEGKAPDTLEGLPAPDAVFIGGTRGNLNSILDVVFNANPEARICITAIALESLTAALSELTSRGLDVKVAQIAASRSRKLSSYNMLTADNPIFIITGGCDA